MNILLSHGSPDPRHREQAALLASRTATALGEAVQAAFLDEAQVPRGARVLPLFLGEGRHAREDVARLSAQSDATLLPPLADVAGRLAEMGVSMAASMLEAREPAIFAFYRFQRFERLLAGVYAQRKRLTKMSIATLHGAPACTDMVRFWKEQGVHRLAVQPMLLFAGRSLDAISTGIEAAGVQIVLGEPLATHAEMPQLLSDCLRGAA